ncbi:MAG: cupin domain-containing protein [Alcanivoracaceae bacterium]|nr:cupin domain-containing protein [Alcanivoracaceae bacterium]
MSEIVSKSVKTDDQSLNVLNDVLNTLRFRGNIFFRSKLAAPWGFSFAKVKSPRFHIALNGDFYIGAGGHMGQTVNVKHMDIVMVPHGDMHWIADQSNSPLKASQDANIACELGSPFFQNGKITNKLICGIVHYEKDILHPIIDSLPSVLHFSNIESHDPIWMTVMLIDAEMQDDFSGKTLIIDRLTEVLFLQLLNRYVSGSNEKSVSLQQ